MNKQASRTLRRVLAVMLAAALLLTFMPVTAAFAAVEETAQAAQGSAAAPSPTVR